MLWTRSSAWHPVLLASSFRRRHASPLVGLALLADVGAMGLLLTDAASGGVLASGVIAVYTGAGLAAHGASTTSGCRCMWRVLNTSTKAAFLLRNTLLMFASAAVAVAPPGSIARPGLVAAVIGLIVLALILRAVDRSTRPSQGLSHQLRGVPSPAPEGGDAPY